MASASVRCVSFKQCSRGLKTISIIGAGLMGSGIAEVSLRSGYEVTLVDLDHERLSTSVGNLRTNFTRVAHKKFGSQNDLIDDFIHSRLSNLKTSINLEEATSHSDLVIEAIVEDVSTKKNLFRVLEKCVPPTCVLTTNTSSISLKDLSSVLGDQTRFAGLHFFQPVSKLKLVEVVRTEHTSDITFKALTDFARSLEKTAITCKDTPGFVVNRLLVPYLFEAIRMAERGDATFEDIDRGMKLGAGYPMGPIELCDLVGLDTLKYIGESLSSQLPNESTLRCPASLEQLVSENKLGKKSGQGFYTYDLTGKRIK